MVQILQPYKTKVLTRDGEISVNITLELNINLNSDGNLQIKSKIVEEPKEIEKKEEDYYNWDIPDFSSSEIKKVKFGKKAEE